MIGQQRKNAQTYMYVIMPTYLETKEARNSRPKMVLFIF
jgi:hypothetical protein